jgi:hypothetical protein
MAKLKQVVWCMFHLVPVENLSDAKRQTKIICTIRNKGTPRWEIFRILCNSYPRFVEQAVEKLLNYPIPEEVATDVLGKKNCTDLTS